ncbi:hypothetical protein [Maribacter sp. R77961]|uniref:hypothetical protein n=1 Tax=Maribacter sp. R77961 TaxID=3093871 RepID=UPI0037C92AD3
MKYIFLTLSILAMVLSSIWLFQEPSIETGIVLLGGVAGLLSTVYNGFYEKKDNSFLFFEKFQSIWEDDDLSVNKKLNYTKKLLPKKSKGLLIYLDFKLEININEMGDAEIIWSIKASNIGSKSLLGESKSIWFEKNQKDDINIIATTSRAVPIQIQLQRDYENMKQFFVNFVDSIKPKEVFDYSYSYTAKKMFTKDHYWDWQVAHNIVNAEIIINQQKEKKFKTCNIINESEVGISNEIESNLSTMETEENKVTIKWIKAFPKPNSKYKITWEFYENE